MKAFCSTREKAPEQSARFSPDPSPHLNRDVLRLQITRHENILPPLPTYTKIDFQTLADFRRIVNRTRLNFLLFTDGPDLPEARNFELRPDEAAFLRLPFALSAAFAFKSQRLIIPLRYLRSLLLNLFHLRVSASPREIRIDFPRTLPIIFPSVRRPVRRRKAKIDLPAEKTARTNCVLKKRSLKSEYGLESLGFDPDPESGFEI